MYVCTYKAVKSTHEYLVHHFLPLPNLGEYIIIIFFNILHVHPVSKFNRFKSFGPLLSYFVRTGSCSAPLF